MACLPPADPALLEEAKALCAAALNCPPQLITLQAALGADLGADSFGRATLAALMEDRWGLTIPDEEFFKMETLGQMLRYCLDHEGSGPAPLEHTDR